MILAIDTATRWTGLALHDGRAIVAEAGWQGVNNQTIELAPAVADMLRKAGLTPNELAAIALAIGPGSYTGLRIGLGFAKGMSVANGTRLIGVPTLDIVAAAQPRAEGPLLAVAEAGRTRICVGRYVWRVGRGWESKTAPTIETWEDLLANLEEPASFAGEISPVAAQLIRGAKKEWRLASPASSPRRAGYLADIAWRRLRRGRVDDAAALTPIYLRDPSGASPKKED